VKKLPPPKSKPEEGDKPDAYKKALGLLVRREHSQKELVRKLRAKGTDPADSAAALAKLAEQGYQDDSRFGEMLVRTRLGKGYGPLHIRAELGTHGIGEAVAATLLADAAPDWPELARDALRRRYAGRPAKDRADALKRAHFLQRRGFDTATARTALEEDSEE
jgi:regulatory protein